MQVRDIFILVIRLVVIIGGIDILFTALSATLLSFTTEFDVLNPQ